EEGVIIEELVCTNRDCQAVIKSQNIRKVLQPSGFVTDAYVPASNDIQHQKFIPVEPAWVFVSADKAPLPNPAVGMMCYGTDGLVFNHSAGEYGDGFALCMTCGRAESMLPNGEFPKSLSPTGEHYPPRPTKDDKDQNNKRAPRPGRWQIHANCKFGGKSLECVVETNPPPPGAWRFNGEPGPGTRDSPSADVRLRRSLASILGIS